MRLIFCAFFSAWLCGCEVTPTTPDASADRDQTSDAAAVDAAIFGDSGAEADATEPPRDAGAGVDGDEVLPDATEPADGSIWPDASLDLAPGDDRSPVADAGQDSAAPVEAGADAPPVDAEPGSDSGQTDASPSLDARRWDASGGCTSAPIAYGSLNFMGSSISFDGRPVALQVAHKVDADADEDGCVAKVTLDVKHSELGCSLHLDFAARTDLTGIALIDASLVADSFCPGIADAQEGTYTFDADSFALLAPLPRVVDRTALSSCVDADLRASGWVVLRHPFGEKVRVDLSSLLVQGPLPSAGDARLRCPCATGTTGLDCASCYPRFQGDGCSSCAAPYWGELCAYRCDDERMLGPGCTTCVEGFQDDDGDGTCAPDCATAGLEGCAGHGDCATTTGVAVCTCDETHSGPSCASCASGLQDQDGDGTCLPDCATADLSGCSDRGHCSVIDGAARCVCDQGYAGPVCDSCASGYQDSDDDGSCNPTCATAGLAGCSGNGTCSSSSGTAVCTCDAGFIGDRCQKIAFVLAAAGADHSCGLRLDGTVSCWGRGVEGQTQVPALSFTDISADNNLSCGILASGGIRCWGDDFNDRDASVPADEFVRISTGYNAVCAVRANGQAGCWGWHNFVPGSYYRVAAGTSHVCGIQLSNLALRCADLTGTPPTGAFVEVTSGTRFSCAIRESDRGISCWGVEGYVPTPPATGRYNWIDAGWEQVCALTEAGEIRCWNGGWSIPPLGEYIDVAVGNDHACAVRSDGVIRCWGDDRYGEAPMYVY